MDRIIITERLVLRGWQLNDAAGALTIFGRAEVTRWLTPNMDPVPDLASMRLLLQQWIAEDAHAPARTGRWVVQRFDGGRVIGEVILQPLPGENDLQISWHLTPDAWGYGYATEAHRAVADWAFSQAVSELFLLIKPENGRAFDMVTRNHIKSVGETIKYYSQLLLIYGFRPEDLHASADRDSLPGAPSE